MALQIPDIYIQYDSKHKDMYLKNAYNLPKDTLYLAGHSLGPQPKNVQSHIESYLSDWSQYAVEGHFKGERSWVNYHTRLQPMLARLCGAKATEVVPMGTLSMNLHLLLATFYRGGNIAVESGAFSSDVLVIDSFLKKYGTGKVCFIPSNAYGWIDEAAVEPWLEMEKPSMVLLGLVQYKTGQVFDIAIWNKLKSKFHFTFGLDLAHAIGNIPLKLSDWDIDFAVWCSYKYLNAGPGAIAGIFIHEKHHKKGPALHGWWGHTYPEKFEMQYQFRPYDSAEAWQLSNPSIISLVCLESALQIFDTIDLNAWHLKTIDMQLLLRTALIKIGIAQKDILTQSVSGAMCSLKVPNAQILETQLKGLGCTVDARGSEIIRFSFNPLYHTFGDIWTFVCILEKAFKKE